MNRFFLRPLILTAVKSAPKNPCSMPDQKVRGMMSNCSFLTMYLKVATSNCNPVSFSLSFFSSVIPNLCRGSTKRAMRIDRIAVACGHLQAHGQEGAVANHPSHL